MCWFPLHVNATAENLFLIAVYLFSQVKKIEDSIRFIRARPKPLVIYAFTRDEKLKKRIVEETSSGSVTINDALVQVLCSQFLEEISVTDSVQYYAFLDIWCLRCAMCICCLCSTYAIQYHSGGSVRVDMGSIMASSRSTCSAMGNQYWRGASWQSSVSGIRHGMGISYRS